MHSPNAGERRRNPRVTPDPLLVIRFSSGNSGVVLDVSREGLSFLASAPVEETHSVRFEIAGRQTLTSEAIGRVMWKDSTGKRAGVKFTQLPEELRALIQRCLPAAAPPPGIQQDNSVPRRVLDDTEDFAFEESTRSFPLANPKRMVFVANGVTCALACLIALGIWHSVYQRDAVFTPLHWRQEASRAMAFLHTLRNSADVSNAAHIAVRIFKDSADPVSSSAKAAVPVRRISIGTLPLPSALPAMSDLSALSATKKLPLGAAVSREFAEPPDNSRAKESAARTDETEHAANAAGEGPAAVIMARELLHKDATSEQRDEALRLLWQAVAKGNLAAELELAEVYLAGQGAAKSCSQARVLLNAAVSRKSELARQKLANLGAYGCE
jgi:hypothetical protein